MDCQTFHAKLANAASHLIVEKPPNAQLWKVSDLYGEIGDQVRHSVICKQIQNIAEGTLNISSN